MAFNLGFPLVGMNAPSVGTQAPRRSWQERLFDRLSPGADIDGQDKRALVRQGLLQLAAGIQSSPNFGEGLTRGLLAGTQNLSEGAHDLQNQRYQRVLMQRTMAGADRNSQIEALQGQLANPDGSINEAKFRQYAAYDPQGAKAYRDAIAPQTRYQLGNLGTPEGGSVPVFYDPTSPGTVLDVSGRPVFGGQQMPTGGAKTPIFGDAFFAAQEQAESGGNPFAVSPKGARGPMQIMPDTAAAPGFGMAPLPPNATPEQNRAFGQEYMRRITEQVGGDPRLGLAAYNWGIGNVQRLQQQGATPEQILAASPPETQAYVAKILSGSRAGLSSLPGYTPPKGKTAEQYRTMTADEVRALGLPQGTVAQMSPNGQVQIINKPRDLPAGGQVLENEDGTTTFIPAGKTTEGERNAAGFYKRMVSASQQLEALTKSGYDPTSLRDFAATGRTLTNFAASPKGQQYYQAAMNWVRANLRKESGAAIGVDEARQEIRNYFPQPGDSAAVIAQKDEQRRVVEQAMRTAAGGALPPVEPRAPKPAAPTGKTIRYDAKGNRLP